MDLGLKGKVAIVAAASKGLGKAVALELAREGASVTIFSRNEEAIQAAGEEVRAATGAQVLALAADVTRAEDLERVVEATARRFGRIDILFNNAGGPPPGTFEQFGDEAWQRAFELNLLSAIRLIRLVLPYMKQAGSGRIINSTSIAVKQPVSGLILSNAIRTGLVGMAKTLADELAPYNITVNNVAPGRIYTERIVQLLQDRAARTGKRVEELRREDESAIPMGRYGRPDEYAAMVTFLASERASYITGATILVDGGLYRGTM